MTGIKDIRMKKKLIIFFLIAGLVPLAISGIWATYSAQKALNKQAFNQLNSVRESKKIQIEDYFEKSFLNMELLSRSKDVTSLYEQLVDYHNTTNVEASGAYDVSTPAYKKMWDEYGSNVTRYQQETGYYDIFLICAAHGHVMYSATKEDDLGTNMGHGPYRDSGLAKTWAKTVETGKRSIVDFSPYEASNNEPAAFVGVPVKKNGVVIGVMAVQLSLDHINTIMQERTGLGDTGETYLVGPDKHMRSDSFLDKQGRSVKASFAGSIKENGVDTEASRQALAGKADTQIIADYNGNQVLSSYTPVKVGDLSWALLAEIDKAEVNKPIRDLELSMGLTALVLTGAIVVLALFISKQIAGPLAKGVEFAKLIASKDLTTKLDIQQKDEIGDLATALNEMVGSLGQMINDIDDGVSTLSSSSTEMSAIASQMSSSAEMTVSKSNTVSAAAEEMNTNMSSVAAAMEQASTNISTVAAGTEEMSTSISEISENTSSAKTNVTNAVERSQKASVQVNELGQAAEEIEVVTDTIKAISDKTNLLALNATIEAARAGEAGKGFAVVANEIKDLAKQTAEATEDIASKLQGIQSSTGMTVTEIQEVSGAIHQVDEVVTAIAAAVEQQNASTAEISENVGQASMGLQEINENVTQSSTASGEIASEIAEVNEAAGEMSNSSAQVEQTSSELSTLAEQLKGLVGQFKI